MTTRMPSLVEVQHNVGFKIKLKLNQINIKFKNSRVTNDV